MCMLLIKWKLKLNNKSPVWLQLEIQLNNLRGLIKNINKEIKKVLMYLSFI